MERANRSSTHVDGSISGRRSSVLFHSKPRSTRYDFRSFIFGPHFERADIQHHRIDLVNKLPTLVGSKTQRVIFGSVWPAEMRHYGAIWSEISTRQQDGIPHL